MKLYDLSPKHWSFLTGPEKDVEKVYKAWGMWAKPRQNGQLDHPSRVYLVDAKAGCARSTTLVSSSPHGLRRTWSCC